MLETPTAVYLRVSTEDQAKEGFSINAQKEKLTKYAEINDWDIYDFYIDDGISGKNIKDRSEVNRLLEDVKQGKVKNILVYKLDRLTRSVADLISLINLFESNNCAFNSHTEKIDTTNAVGRMFVKMLGIFAEFERENLAERVAFGYEQKTREGNYTNTNGVYGYDYIIGEGLEVNIAEKGVVNNIYNWYLNGDSMISICRKLNSTHTPTKRGGKWAGSTIRSILTNPLYIGKVRYGVANNNKFKQFVVDGNNIEVIIDAELWNNVQVMMNKRKKFHQKKFSSEDTYFSLVLRCDICGSKYSARGQVQQEKKYITYACNGRYNDTCSASGFSHQKLETSFLKYLDQIEYFKFDEQLLLKKQDIIDSNQIRTKINKELNKIEYKKNETRNLFISDNLPTDEYQLMLKQLNERKEALLKELEITKEPVNEKLEIKDIKGIVNNLKLNWEHLTNKEKKNFLERFVKTISVKKDNDEVVISDIQF